jgi:hypothetical protein
MQHDSEDFGLKRGILFLEGLDLKGLEGLNLKGK